MSIANGCKMSTAGGRQRIDRWIGLWRMMKGKRAGDFKKKVKEEG